MAAKLGSAYVDIGLNSAKLSTDMAQIQNLLRKQLRMQGRMFNKMGASANRTASATKKVATGFGAALKNALSLQRVINRIAFIATVGIAYGFARAISNAFKSSIKYAIDFEKQMANVYTMLDKVDKKSKGFLALGIEKATVDFGESAETLSKGLYDILSASTPVIQSLYVLETASMAAAAGMSDTKTAADAITSVLNAYQLSAGRAADVSDWLFSVVKKGKLTFADLAQNLGKVISSASIGGLSLEELGASIATMTRQGVKTRESMTSLNRLILTFIKPTKEAGIVARKFGMELNANTLRTLGLTGVIQKLNGASKEELAILGTTVRAFKALAAGVVDVTGQLDDLEEITNRAGSTQDAFNEVAETTAFRMSQARESIKLTGKEIGEFFLPMLSKGAEGWRNFFRAMRGIDFSELEALNNFIKRVAFSTEEVLVAEKKYFGEHAKNQKGKLHWVNESLKSLELEKRALIRRRDAGEELSLTEWGRITTLKALIEQQKESVEKEEKQLIFFDDRLKAINAEIAARKKLAEATDPEDEKKALEELIAVQRERLSQAKANEKGEIEAMKNLIATYETFKGVLITVGAKSSEVEKITTAIAVLNKQMREFGETTEDTTKVIVEATITWQEAIRDYSIKAEDIMESAISSIGGAWSDLWSDIAAGQNMMKKNWAEYLKSLVDSFIAAVSRMAMEWLAFKALMAGINLAFGVPGMNMGEVNAIANTPVPMPTNGIGGGNSSPVINNSVNASFSRRDMAFIVQQGTQHNRITQL